MYCFLNPETITYACSHYWISIMTLAVGLHLTSQSVYVWRHKAFPNDIWLSSLI
jgi:hypothetical protein